MKWMWIVLIALGVWYLYKKGNGNPLKALA